ncbi:MAG: YndJ family transporter [Lewinellaceae bacterium]|nr:YndJ family transporter [Lewinellaceae bacterium]
MEDYGGMLNFRYWSGLTVLVWIVSCFLFWMKSPHQLPYVYGLVLAVPLVLVPRITRTGWPFVWGCLLVVAALFNAGFMAAIFALPWLIWVCQGTVNAWRQESWHTWPGRLRLAAWSYLPVGALWWLADRWGWFPFGFDPTIGLLTAAHFHYAGFALPWLTAVVLPQAPGVVTRWGAGLVIGGIGMVAIGILGTQWGFPYWIEMIAVTLLVAGAWVSAWGFARRSFQEKDTPAILWRIAALSLLAGMGLALLYGWRVLFPVPGLTIPWMYALHGTLNALGFAAPGVWAATWNPGYGNTKRASTGK